MPPVSDVRGLHRSRMEQLDSGTAGVRRLLLPRRVQLSFRRTHEHHEPRDRADAGPLGESGQSAEGLLRPDAAEQHLDAVSGRREQGRPEELQGHGGCRVRLPVVMGCARTSGSPVTCRGKHQDLHAKEPRRYDATTLHDGVPCVMCRCIHL